MYALHHTVFLYALLFAALNNLQTEMALRLNEWSKTLTGMQAYCVKAYAEALEVSSAPTLLLRIAKCVLVLCPTALIYYFGVILSDYYTSEGRRTCVMLLISLSVVCL
jgi:hypothetical protein